uniref:Uncharacterized protein n=1 Tax=Nelumbo nucifera TaxID=4432 RepID=A0A822Y086_NELNU|nr:TPA_asm: hypothetical protein HUJ06_025929 [Nelumbo nucifera]
MDGFEWANRVSEIVREREISGI